MKLHILPGIGNAKPTYQLVSDDNRNLGFTTEAHAWNLVLREGVPILRIHRPSSPRRQRTRFFERAFDAFAP